MKTDPNKACANVEQRMLWALVHDGIAHPLMAITGYSRPAMRFHDWTSQKAWPRFEVRPVSVFGCSRHGNALRAWDLGSGFWCVEHPRIDHSITVKAPGLAQAIRQADDWFDSLELDGSAPATVRGPETEEWWSDLSVLLDDLEVAQRHAADLRVAARQAPHVTETDHVDAGRSA